MLRRASTRKQTLPGRPGPGIPASFAAAARGTAQGGRSMAEPTDAGTVKHPPIVWEHVPCPLCKAHAGELLLSAAGDPPGTVYRLVRCRFCGLGYVNPRPDAGSIGQ